MEDNKSFRIPLYSGLLTDGHPARIGGAIWVFLWMIDRTTEEKDIEIEGKVEKLGVVLSGEPVSHKKIAAELKTSEDTIMRSLSLLEKENYLIAQRHNHGKVYFVRKSKKWDERYRKPAVSGVSDTAKVRHLTKQIPQICGTQIPQKCGITKEQVLLVTDCHKDTVQEPPKPPLVRFEQIWKRYPKKIEKPLALERFQKSVTTEKDWADINKALDNYLAYLEEERHGDFYPVKHGSVWFRDKNWKSWVDWVSAKQSALVIPEDVRVVIDIWKEINGFQGVAGWDDTFAADCIQPAGKLLTMAEGNTGLIREALASIRRYFSKNKLSWKFSTAVEWFPKYLAEQR